MPSVLWPLHDHAMLLGDAAGISPMHQGFLSTLLRGTASQEEAWALGGLMGFLTHGISRASISPRSSSTRGGGTAGILYCTPACDAMAVLVNRC